MNLSSKILCPSARKSEKIFRPFGKVLLLSVWLADSQPTHLSLTPGHLRPHPDFALSGSD